MIPLIDSSCQYAARKGEMDAAILNVMSSTQSVLGPHVRAFEASVAVAPLRVEQGILSRLGVFHYNEAFAVAVCCR